MILPFYGTTILGKIDWVKETEDNEPVFLYYINDYLHVKITKDDFIVFKEIEKGIDDAIVDFVYLETGEKLYKLLIEKEREKEIQAFYQVIYEFDEKIKQTDNKK